jgi:DNA gyrase subunit A
MDEHIFDKTDNVDLKKTMEKSYIEYAMSVIASRALPDVRDGLKPVQRRILYAMIELNNTPDKPHRKCARIVGDTMGKFHPHGDSSIYGALVCLAQPWNTRYPLVDGHGNFGSVDGDGAAAMRYTEARLSKISMEMITDINKDTVDFVPNFDETEKEPVVMPSRIPQLLVNGTTGIAVGMATNMPPHNLGEIINAVLRLISDKKEGRETTIEDILSVIKGPDFPTGAIILGRHGIEEAYRTGRGKILVRAVSNIEAMPNGKNRIIVTELPYLVNKAKLIEDIAALVRDKKLDGITALRDESDRDGMRICIELRKDVNANVMLNNLYKHTQLQDTFGVINLALVNNEPRILTLMQMLQLYLKHQEDVIKRRTAYDLNKALERAHILEGLLIAIDNIDEAIAIIRKSSNVNEAKINLIARFSLDDVQAQAIVDMRMRALTGLEHDKIKNEHDDLEKQIVRFKEILGDEKELLGVIEKEITAIRDKYSDERRTKINLDYADMTNEDLIPDVSTVIAMTKLGYIKRMSVDNFKSQHRGGKGIKGMQTIEDDYIEDLIMTTAHHYIMFFTNKGRAYRIKAYEIPDASRISRGMAIINLLQLQADEKITAMIAYKESGDNRYLIMATKCGLIKKTKLSEYFNIRKSGLIAIGLKENDELIEVKATNGQRDILIITKNGTCIRFNEKDVRSTGRGAMGVRGMNLMDNDEVVAMQLDIQGTDMLIISENGLGKRTPISEFNVQYRGGKGVKCYKITEKSGNVVGAKAVNDDNEIMIITTEGTIIRIAAADISTSGRNTTGVKLINMDAGKEIKVARFTKVKENTASGDSDKALENLQSEFERESDPVEEEEPETDENITNETNAYDDEQADISKTFTKEDSGIETLIERALKDKENEEEKAGDDSTESSDNDNLN